MRKIGPREREALQTLVDHGAQRLANPNLTSDTFRELEAAIERVKTLLRPEPPVTPPSAPHSLDVAAGDYRLVLGQVDVALVAYRHGEPWRDCTGDQLVLALGQRVAELEARCKETGTMCLEEAIALLKSCGAYGWVHHYASSPEQAKREVTAWQDKVVAFLKRIGAW